MWALPGKVCGNRIYPWKEELDKKFGVSLDIGINSQSQCSQGKEWGDKMPGGGEVSWKRNILRFSSVLPYWQPNFKHTGGSLINCSQKKIINESWESTYINASGHI